MSVWFAIPSARPVEQVRPVVDAWRERGYRIALFVDWNPPGQPLETRTVQGDIMLRGGGQFEVQTSTETRRYYPDFDHYPGYAQAVNALVAEVIKRDENAQWFVTGGDDTWPDPNHTADEIAEQCNTHFIDIHLRSCQDKEETGSCAWTHEYKTFGVMQPTGDRFAGGSIDRIAGSPWMGREWCLRANQGKGPLWPEFTHMFGDECLKRTAEKLGVYWARPDLIHLHKHFQRESDALDARAVHKPVPAHLKQWNTRQHWDEMKAIFKRLEAEDFASCMPL